jgi:hypothetical protein
VHAPIPAPALWIMSGEAEPPPGHLTLWAAALSVRRRSAEPSTDLALPAAAVTADRDLARAQLDELLATFVRMTEVQRGRLIEHAAAMLREADG